MVRKFPTPGKFPFQRTERVEKKIAKPVVPQEGAAEFKPLMEVDWNPTPEEIAEFGVPLLPLPLPLAVMRPVPFPDIDEEMTEIDARIYDEDGDPRYAACTPPPEGLGVSEEKTTAPAVNSEHVVGLGPDVNSIVGDLCKSD